MPILRYIFLLSSFCLFNQSHIYILIGWSFWIFLSSISPSLRFFKMWNTFICISKYKIIFIISTYRDSGTSTTTEPALLCRTTWQNYSLHPQNGNKSLNRQHSFLIWFFSKGKLVELFIVLEWTTHFFIRIFFLFLTGILTDFILEIF